MQLEHGFNNEPVTGPKAPRFCGQRLRRLNPCWREQGVASCLPHFFILGEMKCGTTSLYHFLRMHPRVVVPRVKEPRFLQAGVSQATACTTAKDDNARCTIARPSHAALAWHTKMYTEI